jgi:ubiquinone/menaquinone biosynthesis C-methylase UbiE
LFYIDAATTRAAAKARGQSVPDYVADLWGERGLVEKVTTFLFEQAQLPNHPVILEIGPGTGRFLDPIQRHYSPSHYEVYETNRGWAEYLGAAYPVEIKTANGRDLSQTPDNSCDVVHAHGVFTYLPVTTTFGYFGETCRVLKPGGFAFFDAILDDQCTVHNIEVWRSAYETYQRILPRSAVVQFFAERGCRQLPREITVKPDRGERYIIFQKTDLIFSKK